jgi:hypothetical protein
VLGPAEVVASLGAFVAVLFASGWTWGAPHDPAVLATASGTAFAAIVLAQLANAYACRSETRPVWRVAARTNKLLPGALAAELGLLVTFVTVPAVARPLGGGSPGLLGWTLAACAIPIVLVADTIDKAARGHGRTTSTVDATVRERLSPRLQQGR